MSNQIKPVSTGLILYKYYKGYLKDILCANRLVAEQKIKEACNITNEEPLSLQDKVQKLCEFSSGNKFWDWFLHRKIAKVVAHLFDMSTPEELETIKDITDEKTQAICLPILQDRKYRFQKRAEQLVSYFQDRATTASKAEKLTLQELQITYFKKARSHKIQQHSTPKWYAVLHIDTSKQSAEKEGILVLTSLSDKPPTELQPNEYVAVFGSEIESFLQKATLFQIIKKVTDPFGEKPILEKHILWNTSCEAVVKEFVKIQQEQGVQSVITETAHLLPESQFQKLMLYRALTNEVFANQVSEHEKVAQSIQHCQTLLDERTALTQQKQMTENKIQEMADRANKLTANMVEEGSQLLQYKKALEELHKRTEYLTTDQGLKTVPEIKMLQVQTQKTIEQQEDLLLQIQALDTLSQRLDSQDLSLVIQEITQEHLQAVKEFTTIAPAKKSEIERKIKILLKQIKYLQKTQNPKKLKKLIEKDLKNLLRKEKKEEILAHLCEEIQKNKEMLHKYTELLQSAPIIIEQQKQRANVKQFVELYVDPKMKSFRELVKESDALNIQRCNLEMQLSKINDNMKKNAKALASMPSIEELKQRMKSIDNLYSQSYMELEYQAIQDLALQQKIAQAVLASPKL